MNMFEALANQALIEEEGFPYIEDVELDRMWERESLDSDYTVDSYNYSNGDVRVWRRRSRSFE